jgi:hypothetical protein
VTPDSGCMLVVPAQHDPLFAASNHPLHMKPTEAMPWAHIRALPAAAGDILLWKANLIHWGSSCGSFCHREDPKIDPKGIRGRGRYSFWIHTLSPPSADFELSASLDLLDLTPWN